MYVSKNDCFSVLAISRINTLQYLKYLPSPQELKDSSRLMFMRFGITNVIDALATVASVNQMLLR